MNTTSNGIATAAKKNSPNQQTPTLTPVPLSTGTVKTDIEKPISLEDKILKVQMLSDLTAKREKLLESLKKINSFNFSSETRLDKLTIEDEHNNEFITTNTDVLKEVVATIKATILAKIASVENQIIF